jgi:uncharacterized membrane protein YkvA (DUF1232 family)
MRTIVLALAAVLTLWLFIIIVLVVAGRRSAAREVATLLPNLIALFRELLGDRRVPRTSKLFLGFAVAWFLSPIDLVPEFVPVAGPLDDAIVAALVLRHVLRRAGRSVVEEHWRGDPRMLAIIVRIAGRRRPLSSRTGVSGGVR